MDKTPQPRYAIKPKTCKYSYILRGYNKWCIFNFFKVTTNPEERDIKEELVLSSMTWVSADNIENYTIGEFRTSESNTPGYYIFQ